MDFGVVGLDGFVSPESPVNGSNGETAKLVVGSGLAKHERPSESAQDACRSSKIPRSDDFYVSRGMALHQHGSGSLLRSNSMLDSRQHEQMLSFASLKPQVTPFLSKDGVFIDKVPQYFHYNPSANVAAGNVGGNMNGSLHGGFNGVRGPFTPSQWMELEHQALIYKYITAKVPVPSNLLIPIKKSLYPYALSASSTGPFPHNSLGWNTFHLGYPGNNTDPEPGRCRRTDGKKWRCSRDAVADQKYCERHINRGRHRSRKPVEGQTGQAATGTTTNSKVVPMTTSVSTSVITSGAASNSLAITPQQFKNVQPAAVNSFTIANRAQDPRGLSMMSSTGNLKSEDSTFSIPKQEMPVQESSQLEFGLVPSDSLLNPSQRTAYMSSKNYESFLNFGDQESQDSLRQYTNDWSKDQPNHSVIGWPEELKSDWTQLSMSIPMTSSEFSSSTSSPARDKAALSPLRLSREFDTSHMGLGVHNNPSEFSQKHANWIPISWGNSMGGPLGEVLTTSAGNASNCENTSSLSLLTEGWDGSPQLGSSPTGVLQKATYGSLSNSSSGSSPRTEILRNNDGVNLRDDVLGSTIVSSKSNPIPSL